MKPILLQYKLFILLTVVLYGLPSCKKLIEIDAPSDKIVSTEVFKDDLTATSAMLGLYQDMTGLNGSLGNSGLSLYPGLSADELYRNTSIAVYDEFSNNALTSGNSLMGTYIWNKAYNLIFQANSILAGIDNNPAISVNTRNQLTGEAKFIRAFYHFYVYNLFGPAPLVTSINYRETASVGRIPAEEMYASIVADLLDARAILPENYASAGKVRINKWAVNAFLARVYLYQGNWKNAETMAAEVIRSGGYTLVQNLNNVFLANSTEAIFQLLPTGAISASTINTWDGNGFIPAANAVPAYNLAPSLLNAFSDTDKRKINWIGTTVVGGKTYAYPYKYKVRTGASITEYYMFIRYAELFLIRAEAYANQGLLSQAIADLDILKERAGIPLIRDTNPSIAQAPLLDEIIRERQRELFVEFGHRWLDLKRTNRVDAVLGAVKPNWKPTSALYPIPFTETQRNTALAQNPGYN